MGSASCYHHRQPGRANWGIPVESTLARVREVLQDDDRHLAATLAGQHEGEDIQMREQRIARLLDNPEKLRELRQQRAERKAERQQHQGRYQSYGMRL